MDGSIAGGGGGGLDGNDVGRKRKRSPSLSLSSGTGNGNISMNNNNNSPTVTTTPIACSECRKRKSKCDRRIPCGSCIMRGCVDQCQPETRRVPQRASDVAEAVRSLESKVRSLESFLVERFQYDDYIQQLHIGGGGGGSSSSNHGGNNEDGAAVNAPSSSADGGGGGHFGSTTTTAAGAEVVEDPLVSALRANGLFHLHRRDDHGRGIVSTATTDDGEIAGFLIGKAAERDFDILADDEPGSLANNGDDGDGLDELGGIEGEGRNNNGVAGASATIPSAAAAAADGGLGGVGGATSSTGTSSTRRRTGGGLGSSGLVRSIVKPFKDAGPTWQKQLHNALLVNIPQAAKARTLVKLYFRHQAWQIFAVHHSHFMAELDELEILQQQGRLSSVDPAWLALLCQIMAFGLVAAYSVDEYVPFVSDGALQEDPRNLAGAFAGYSASFLAAADWAESPSVRVVQTLIVNGWWGQHFESDSSLFEASSSNQRGRMKAGIALLHCRALGLDKLGNNPAIMPGAADAFPREASGYKRQIALRIWQSFQFLEGLNGHVAATPGTYSSAQPTLCRDDDLTSSLIVPERSVKDDPAVIALAVSLSTNRMRRSFILATQKAGLTLRDIESLEAEAMPDFDELKGAILSMPHELVPPVFAGREGFVRGLELIRAAGILRVRRLALKITHPSSIEAIKRNLHRAAEAATNIVKLLTSDDLGLRLSRLFPMAQLYLLNSCVTLTVAIFRTPDEQQAARLMELHQAAVNTIINQCRWSRNRGIAANAEKGIITLRRLFSYVMGRMSLHNNNNNSTSGSGAESGKDAINTLVSSSNESASRNGGGGGGGAFQDFLAGRILQLRSVQNSPEPNASPGNPLGLASLSAMLMPTQSPTALQNYLPALASLHTNHNHISSGNGYGISQHQQQQFSQYDYASQTPLQQQQQQQQQTMYPQTHQQQQQQPPPADLSQTPSNFLNSQGGGGNGAIVNDITSGNDLLSTLSIPIDEYASLDGQRFWNFAPEDLVEAECGESLADFGTWSLLRTLDNDEWQT